MFKLNKTLNLFVTIIVVSLIGLTSCDLPNHPSYDDENPDPFPTGSQPPQISSISPDRGFAGDEIIIEGTGFKENPDEVMVNIGTTVAEILELSSTHIKVKVPINENGEQKVRVSTWGSEFWSNESSFRYLDDFVEFKFNVANPTGIAIDSEGNMYFGSSSDKVVYKVDGIDSTQTTFASADITGPIKFAPDGNLFVVTGSGVDKISPDGSVSSFASRAGVLDFDFDSNGNLYMLASTRIYRFDGAEVSEVATVTRAQKLRVFENYVYVTELTRSRVSKYMITPTGLDSNEPHFIQNTPLAALDIDENGTVYASAYVRDYIMVARTDRENDSDYIEYPNEEDRVNPFRKIDTRIGSIYIHGSVMYLTQDVGNGQIGKMYRIYIGEKNAPRFGPQN